MSLEQNPNQCNCSQFANFTHELTQSLMVINAYAQGSIERLKKNALEADQLKEILNKINQHIEIMGNKIHCMI